MADGSLPPGFPRQKPEPIECPCSDPRCDKVGQPRRKVWAGETVGHVKGCPCRRCKGGRTVSRSRRREHRIAKDTGGQREQMSGNVTGRDVTTGSGVWVEETADPVLVRGIRRWWGTKAVDRKLRRLRAQTVARWVFVVSWGGKPRLVIEEYPSWAAHHGEEAA